MRLPTLALNSMAVAARFLPIRRPRSEDAAFYSRAVMARARTLYKKFYSRYCEFKGKDIAELGATESAIKYYVSLAPRRYYAINRTFTQPVTEELSSARDAGIVRSVISTDQDIPLPDDSVDVMISENTFEHLIAYERMVAELRRVLRPDGILATQFSPLYYSPYGAHFHEQTKLPWAHLWIEENQLRSLIVSEMARAGQVGFEYVWSQYLTLNKLRPRAFVRPFLAAGWHILTVESWPFAGSHSWPEPLSSLFTHRLRIAARKASA